MEHPHHQPTFDIAAELNPFHQEQASGSAQQAQYNLASDNGTAQLNSSGEHSRPVTTSSLLSCAPELSPAVPPNSKKRKRTRDWEEAETSALLEGVNMPEFRHQKRKQYYMKWDAIAADIQSAVGSDPAVITGKRCNERMKTLRGCYEKVTKEKEKKEAGVTAEEWRRSKGIAVDWWYDVIGEFCGPRKGKLKDTTAATEINVSYNDESVDRTPATETYATRFNSLTKWQRSTLLDLHFFAEYFDNRCEYSLSLKLWRTCERLSSMKNRTCLAIYVDVIALQKMGLFMGKSDDGEGEESSDDDDADEDLDSDSCCSFSGLLAHETFFQKAVAEDRNPAYDTSRTFMDNPMVTFDATCAPSRITMLFLHECRELEVVNMSGFRQLRFVSILGSRKLREMIGWECLEELRCLEVWKCPLYHGYPPLQKMPSLQEFVLIRGGPCSEELDELDVSGCVRLRSLEICSDPALSSIRGLEGLHSPTALTIWECKALRKLPDIGHMKDLTHLTMFGTCVEEIKGVETLSSLKDLNCCLSKLKTLPDLRHLPYLRFVRIVGCPLVKDPSSLYYNHESL